MSQREFQTEVSQLLHLIVHSLYSHPEIFLRELVSNASDAADKLRFEALDHPDYYAHDPDLRIRVSFRSALYSHPEIFLRELVSNASDAADKLRFEALDHPDYYENDPDLRIRVSFDKDAGTITVRDNGVGMSYDEVIANIGTIAKSGTREFFASL